MIKKLIFVLNNIINIKYCFILIKMGYITIQSENNDISWILGKKPDSGMICRNLRAGVVYGWYSNPKIYTIRFIDYTDEISFKKNYNDKYNYLGSLQYCSPLLLSSVISELFGSNLNKLNPKDTPYQNKLTQHIIKLNHRALGFISKLNSYIKKFKINTIQLKYSNLYRIDIESDGSIMELLNYSYLLGFILNILVVGYVDKPNSDQLTKMINFMVQINMPYYPRYLIKTNMMSHTDFIKLKNKLETFNDMSVIMQWGNSQTQRYEFIESNISLSSDIIDFGCGEGYYVKKIIPKLSNKYKYIAWDVDLEELEKVKYFKFLNPEYENLILADSEEKLYSITNDLIKPTILLSEVFEHIEPNEAIILINKIKSNIDFGKIIISTPDVGFNKHYSPDYDKTCEINMRHSDHKYEYTQDEFIGIISKLFEDDLYSKKFYNIGDKIDSNSITQGYIISPLSLK